MQNIQENILRNEMDCLKVFGSMNFENMIELIDSKKDVPNYEILQLKYNIKNHNIDKLDCNLASIIYGEILQKYKKKKIKRNWCENQLRLFVWILFHFSNCINIPIQNFKEKEWKIIANIFQKKDINDCKFQWLSLIKIPDFSDQWCTQQDQLLISIINNQIQQNKWNQIAKQLYKNSFCKFFRKPKQCRQRWRNYLDPEIEKGKWSLEEDQKLLNLVLEYGKKWSIISKHIKNRTEHSVKNRYKSMIRKYCKISLQKFKKDEENIDQQQIIKNLLNGFKNQIQICCEMKEETPDQFFTFSSQQNSSKKQETKIQHFQSFKHYYIENYQNYEDFNNNWQEIILPPLPNLRSQILITSQQIINVDSKVYIYDINELQNEVQKQSQYFFDN